MAARLTHLLYRLALTIHRGTEPTNTEHVVDAKRYVRVRTTAKYMIPVTLEN